MNNLNRRKKLSELEFQHFETQGYWKDLDPFIYGLANDSTNTQPGYIFFAIAGRNTHGANFAINALENGAIFIVTDPEGAKILRDSNIQSPVMIVSNPRQKLAEYAARWNEIQPKTQIAVTGTNGKTSVCHFLLQIWQFLGKRAASIGTLGVQGELQLKVKNTTPDAIDLHKILRELAQNDVEYLSMEASSHGLDQSRLDGVILKAAAFTNLSQDHMDYHVDEDSYLASKCILFDKVLPDGQLVVLNIDDPVAEVVKLVSENKGHMVIKVGTHESADLRICDQRYHAEGQILKVKYLGISKIIHLPLIGYFQATNVLISAALAIATGAHHQDVFNFLPQLKNVPGRMELVGTKNPHGKVYVDYAHTPDALLNALKALRLHTIGRLILVFGAGGERDSGKRPLMGKVASQYADKIFITDDNPRKELPKKIREEIFSQCPAAIEIPDRAAAILTAIDNVRDGDVLLIAGKGHETGQEIGDDRLPFNDKEFASMSLSLLSGKKI